MPGPSWRVFDTNIYVTAIREGEQGAAFECLRAAAPRTYLASVVSAELRAGAVDDAGRRAVSEFVDRFSRSRRVVTPDAGSWNHAGDLLADIWRKEPRSRDRVSLLWNDALIALSARQIGATVVTKNVGDFALLRRYARFEYEPFESS
jgi:tRNA(fMet)-specific endonuclease VapC